MASTYEGFVEISSLIREIKKEGRECLYDLSCPDYKNNYKKQKVWAEIAGVLAIDKITCQARWRSVRTKYKLALSKERGKSGSERCELKPMAKFLLREMDFFRRYVADDEPTTSSFIASSSSEQFQEFFDETARDPEVADEMGLHQDNNSESPGNIDALKPPKKKTNKVAEARKEFEMSCKKLDQYSAALRSRVELDPYFMSLQKEMSKVKPSKQNALKLHILSLIYEAQEQDSAP